MATTIDPGTIRPQDLHVLHRAAQEAGPESALGTLLTDLGAALQRGAGAALLAQDKELSPNEAAALLSMSRPHLLGFMDAGALAFHRVGSHRRIRLHDLLEFDARRKAASKFVAEVTVHSADADADHLDREAPISDEALAAIDDL